MSNEIPTTSATPVNTAHISCDTLKAEGSAELIVDLIAATDMDEGNVQKIFKYLSLLPAFSLADLTLNADRHRIDRQDLIVAFVDGGGMACPMPLLKTKVALRQVPDNKALYVTATDPHSQTDIAMFCQQAGYTLLLNTVSTKNTDTIFHFIITKTDSK